MTEAQREVYCADALEWLQMTPLSPQTSLVASLPDLSEFSHGDVGRWSEWFVSAAALILTRCPPKGVGIFFQSDIKHSGRWIDKAYLVQQAAERVGAALLWHKIVCRVPVSTTTFGRPAYSHLLCFSAERRALDLSLSSPDVLAATGEKTWARGMGLEIALFVTRFIAEQTESRTVVNPFCGEGSVLAAANHFGLKAIGIERSPKRAEISRRQNLSPDGKSWQLEV